MELPLYRIDAFTDRMFGGNPAGVIPLSRWLPDATMQAVAAENNQAETAFFVSDGEGFKLRWFTPTVEADLCGHATLGSAFVISEFLQPGRNHMWFDTRSGRLTVTRQRDLFILDLPLRPALPADEPAVGVALGAKPRELLASVSYLAVFDTWEDVAGLKPDLAAVAALKLDGVFVTAPGRDGIDYVARYFAPGAGIPEDPATGSSHCILMPFWAARLGRKRLRARQISQRVGDFDCELTADRVKIGGRAICNMRGSIFVDG
jgi:predicted PhzF superfamily epimerase YddE/YHI9